MQASGFIDYDVCKQPQSLNGLVEGFNSGADTSFGDQIFG